MKNIRARVRNLIETYCTRDPETLAEELGIKIHKRPWGTLKGSFKKIHGVKFIGVNSNLDKRTQLIIIAHELGHAILHASDKDIYLHQYTLTPRGIFEKEASRFAAELLINENDIDNHDLKEMTIGQLSSYCGVPIQFVEFKFNRKQ